MKDGTGPALTEELRRFILTSVPSVPFVEAMLFFRESTSPVTIERLARHLYISERQAAEIFGQLRSARVLTRNEVDGSHVYAPAPEIAPLVEQLAAAYRARLLETTFLIHSRTDRMAQQFADAFKIRKE